MPPGKRCASHKKRDVAVELKAEPGRTKRQRAALASVAGAIVDSSGPPARRSTRSTASDSVASAAPKPNPGEASTDGIEAARGSAGGRCEGTAMSSEEAQRAISRLEAQVTMVESELE